MKILLMVTKQDPYVLFFCIYSNAYYLVFLWWRYINDKGDKIIGLFNLYPPSLSLFKVYTYLSI